MALVRTAVSALALALFSGCADAPSPAAPTPAPAIDAAQDAPATPAAPPKPDQAPPAPAGGAPIEAGLVKAVETPDYTGTLTIEAHEPASDTRDTCTGTVALVKAGDVVEGIGACDFAGPFTVFGTTKGKITVAPDAPTGRFDAAPSPVVAEGTVSWEGTTVTLRFGDTVDVGDGHTLRYTGTVVATRIEEAHVQPAP